MAKSTKAPATLNQANPLKESASEDNHFHSLFNHPIEVVFVWEKDRRHEF